MNSQGDVKRSIPTVWLVLYFAAFALAVCLVVYGLLPDPPREDGGVAETGEPARQAVVKTATQSIVTPEPGPPEIAMPSELDSYHAVISQRMQVAFITETLAVTYTEAWVKNPPSLHIVADVYNFPFVEAVEPMEGIVISNTGWVRMGGGTWTRLETQGMTPLTGMADSIVKSLQDSAIEMTLVGEGVVNDVWCRHYTFTQRSSVTGSQPMTPTWSISATVNVTGNLWIAYQDGLPHVVIRMQMLTEGNYILPLGVGEGSTPPEDMQTYTYIEMDLTRINEPLTIELPEEGMMTR